jgi:AcrR family transcriptional regulator
MNSKRSQRSPEETRRRIIEAAIEIGSEVGYVRATTRAIAESAGVNEVTLFRHFGSKANLFAAAIEHAGGPALASEIEAQLTGEYRRDLNTIARAFFDILLERREILRLLLCESAHIPEVRTVLARNPRELRKMLARYLQSQMDRGAFKKQHPEATAQAFMGMFFAYAISLIILDEPVHPGISDDDLVAQFVEIFISGITVV